MEKNNYSSTGTEKQASKSDIRDLLDSKELKFNIKEAEFSRENSKKTELDGVTNGKERVQHSS